jgi:peptidoglycan-N-acetylglucosamine deacetylase
MPSTIPQTDSRRATVSEPRLRMTTSWDDGDPLDLQVGELLAQYGLSGTFYVPCQNGHTLISAAQARDLAQTFEVGAHTVHHVDLTRVTDAVARTEIAESKQRIEFVTGRRCKSFCFPLGRFARRHVRIVRDAGYKAARTAEMLSLEEPRQMSGVAMIPTTMQAFPHAKFSYWKNLAKRFRANNLPLLIAIGAAKDWASAAVALLSVAKDRGGVFHLWGHSREIEEAGEWGNLERVFRAMREMKPHAVCVCNSELCPSGN